ncbi:MAG: IucA/IucC family protein [Candidatus Woesebacteria bacterium GW2011_GWB1_41_10]|uniref:IucA/IucC family protein n=2 Tax=Microgenomates group TaxID=1794810 RepID=A0A0G0RAA4_9BACT|nr:MAG: IucA/IucC family protein [Candidatus Curtissbacteria bacterium GW2011_GWA1_40_16]KKR86238.1 MAG: IucA/IucC family protein [Candidatus Woesebacteria bacterium GW2011_GWB1_41_10]
MPFELDASEKKIWTWGSENDVPHQVLVNALLIARQSSLERFVGSFLRENIANILDHSRTLTLADWLHEHNYSRDLSLLNWDMKKTKNVMVVSLAKNKLLFLPGQKVPLQRFYLMGTPVLNTDNNISQVSSILEMFDLLYNEAINEPGDWDMFKKDLVESNANLFLAMLLRKIYTEQSENKLPRQILLENQLNKDEMLVFFEQWSIYGHFLHPTPKSKTGLSLSDLLRLLPEAHAKYQLYFGALRKDKARFMSIYEDSESFFQKLFGQLYQKAGLLIEGKGFDAEDYYPILIHPWQYENFLLERIGKELARQDFFLLDDIRVMAQPLIAFRTVFASLQDVYFKLPANIQVTSVKRTLSSKPCHNSVVLSKILKTLKEQSGLPYPFDVQLEVASLRLKEDYASCKNLSMIVRENLNRYIAPDSVVLPAFALFENSTQDKERSIINDLVEIFSKGQHISEGKESVLSFFGGYIKLLLPPVLDLLCKYGIGLEAHLQNSIIAFKEGKPDKFIYRDLDAVNICTKRFDRHSFLKNEFYPDSWTVSGNVSLAQDKVMHSLIHSNIAEMINYISLNYGLECATLWGLVAGEISAHLVHLSADPFFKKEAKEDLDYFFSEFTELKSLLRMKLRGETNNYIHVRTTNPLSTTK